MGLKRWLSNRFGKKSYSMQLIVADDGFMVSANFSGGDLYTVYTQAIWTYICASRISQDIAAFPAVVQVRNHGTNKWVADYGDPLNELLDRPYGTSQEAPPWNWAQMVATGSLRQELCGNQYYRKVSSKSRLLALQLLLADLKGNVNDFGVAVSYTVTSTGSTGTSAEIPASDVVNVMHYNPGSFWSGVSPTIANEQATRVDYASSRRTRYDLETRVQPGVVFKVKNLFKMTADQRTNAEEWITDQFEGATKAGKSLVVGDNTTIEKAPLHPVDDVPTHAKNARDAIISSFDISPPVVGVLEQVKYQTWEQALRAQFNLCIAPRLRNIYSTINTQAITPIYGPDKRIWYDIVASPLGLAALREKAESAKLYLDLGYPANAVNERFQLEMPEYDELERPNMGAVIAGRELEDSDEPQSGEDEPEDDPAEDPDLDNIE